MFKKYKYEITVLAFITVFTIGFIYLYGLILPFIIGLLLAFASLPLIKKLQKVIKNLTAAVTAFLLSISIIVVLFFVFLVQYVNRDFQRLNTSFTTLVADNQDKLDETAQKVKSYLIDAYDFEDLTSELEHAVDSLKTSVTNPDTSGLDTESIKETVGSILSAFKSDDGVDETPEERSASWGFLGIFISTIGYFVLILYQIDYFDGIRKRYFSKKAETKLSQLYDDFDQSFIRYFKLRSKIVWLLGILYATAFIIMDMPGTFLILALIIMLSYIPYLQYLALIPLALSTMVLSIENDQSYLLLMGIVVGVFILATLIEEIFLSPKIMEENIGMNSVVMILALAIWSYLFGLPGFLIGVPITSLMIIHVKRYFLPAIDHVEANSS